MSDGDLTKDPIERAITHHARYLVSAHPLRGFRCVGTCGAGGGEALIVFELVAVVLGIAAIGYLLIALLKPERF
ncbi:potassium-transporting ATPase subunit F [Paeniglutamicibacter antarcticus]|uniref:potassium-transporting ATPase subunit F n=1 Tax=Paeniglutamicibacter antarcticus TaxID=494023 RepID=UPI001AE8A195